MAEVVVADASPIIALARIEQLTLLTRVFSRAIVPLSVYLETQSRPELPDAQSIRTARERVLLHVHEHPIQVVPGLPKELGDGEADAISLAVQINCGVFMDERAGRTAARALGVKTIGTVGVLSLARSKGFVAELKPLISKLQQSGYFLANDLVESVLKSHGELP